MAFQRPTTAPRQILHQPEPIEDRLDVRSRSNVEDSQEWILFSPSQAGESSTQRTNTTQTAGLSRASDLGSLNTVPRSGRLDSTVLDEEEVTEDGELDSLDDGLHAFREPVPLYQPISGQNQGAVLPTHDGLGTFPASSPPVLEQLWQHEQFNPKRKHEGQHRRTSSLQKRLNTIEDLEAQANDDKRMRIEKWRIEQSQALMEEVERETRRKFKRESIRSTTDDLLGTTPKQSDYLNEKDATEPFWRRITRRFIRDVIGIDEPLLSVILGETLVEEDIISSSLPTIPEQSIANIQEDETWRDRLLQRIARELGVFVHQLSPQPNTFNTYSKSPDYAGMPVSMPKAIDPSPVSSDQIKTSTITPNFPPTIQDPKHAENWGFEDDPMLNSTRTESILNLQREREYWERELDVKMVFRYLHDKFKGSNDVTRKDASHFHTEDAARRTAIIRHHHPLVGKTQRSPTRLRRDSKNTTKRPTSSCASESVKSSRRTSMVKSGSSRNYWDIGGSVGSGSVLASGGLIGGWGEV